MKMWQEWAEVESAAQVIAAQNNGGIPGAVKLSRQGFGGFAVAAEKYWGGIPAVRERLGLSIPPKAPKRPQKYKPKKGRTQMHALAQVIKHRAKLKCKECTIDTDFLWALWKQQKGRCALTGVQMQFPQRNVARKQPSQSAFNVSVDRIDSSRGYTPGNIRLVCLQINYALNKFGEESLLVLARALLETQGSLKM